MKKYAAIALILAALALASPLLDGLTLGNPLNASLQSYSTDYLNRVLARTTTALLAFEAVNAAVSVVQDVNVSGSVLVAGAEFSPGELLDPINDLAERFSDMLLSVTLAFSVLRLLLEVNQWLAAKLLLPAILACAGLALVLPSAWSGRAAGVARRAAALLAALYLLVPVSAFLSNQLGAFCLDRSYESSLTSVDHVEQGLRRSLRFDSLEQGVESLKNLPALVADEVKQAAGDFLGHALTLISVFAVQVILVPLATLFVLLKIAGRVLEPSPPPAPKF